MTGLNLRLRIFLFFCLLGLGGIAIVLTALLLGFRQFGSNEALSAFVTVGIASAFGLLALTTFVWRLFDEHVSKPIEALAAQFRVRADAGLDVDIDRQRAQYLGDLAPAASVLHRKLDEATCAAQETVMQRTARLERQRGQLLQVLSDIPVAVIVVTHNHQIALYDGQAADLLQGEGGARLCASVFDYFEGDAVHAALTAIQTDDTARRALVITGRSGALYSGHIRRFGAEAGYTLMLDALTPDAARPLVYDFDLLDRPDPTDLDDTALKDLSFVVFDSETTGLDPLRDDVVQLGAVRVVNAKIVSGERFETLVNPGRPIPPGATRVHRINDAMVADAPGFAEARTAFHAFARGAVLVAHNALFDMAFMRRAPATDGAVFDHPVLDTVHLSAAVFGGSAEHTLDAICDRLGITVPADHRHTAFGDALATAHALTAMIPVLEARGLCTFRKVREECHKHRRILKLQG